MSENNKKTILWMNKYLFFALVSFLLIPVLLIISNIIGMKEESIISMIIWWFLLLLMILPFIFIIIFFITSKKTIEEPITHKNKDGSIVYSLKDKFLSIENEKRITGRQLFSRVFTPWFLMWLLSIFLIFPILWGIVWSISIEYILYMPIIYMLIYYWVILWLVPKLIIKRCHDFNNKWIITRNIFLWLFIAFIATSLTLASSFFVDLWFSISCFNLVIKLRTISQVWLLLIWLYLLFRRWTKWKNEYWDDTSNVKIWLMW